MSEQATLNLRRALKGRDVLAAGTWRRLGEVADAFIHPTEGRLLGLALRTDDGGERLLPLHQLSVRHDGAIVSGGDMGAGSGDAAFPAEGAFALREIVGASVVTEAGELVGHVSDVHLVVRGAGVEYEVAPTWLQRVLGGGLRLDAAAALTFSRAGSRLIVPAAEVGRRLPRPFDGVRAWAGTRSWELGQSARPLLNKYGVPLWFVSAATLLGMMFWL